MRRLTTILLTVTCIAFVSACSSSKHAASDSTTTTQSPATSAPNGSTAAPTTQTGGTQPGGATTQPGGATTQSTPTAAASNACKSSNLKLGLGSAQGAAGHTYTPIVFTNTGASTCTMIGYPGVSNVSASGAQIGAAADRMTDTPHVVTLTAGEHTTATLEETDLGIQSGCEQSSQTARAAAILVYPPNNTVAIKISRSKQVCSNATIHQLSVSAVGSAP